MKVLKVPDESARRLKGLQDGYKAMRDQFILLQNSVYNAMLPPNCAEFSDDFEYLIVKDVKK